MKITNDTDRRQAGDTRLLLIIAGCVVAGAAALAMLAGLAERRQTAVEASPAVASRPAPRRAPAPVSQIVPAVSVPTVEPAAPETASLPKVPGSTVDAVTVFEIDPDADLIAEGSAAWNSRQYDRAAAYFAAEVDARPDRSWTQYMLGLSRWKQGEPVPAAGAMERALELDPTSIKAAVNLSRIRNDLGEFEAALAAAETAVALDADQASAHFVRARSLFNLERFEEAVSALETSLTLDDTNGHAHNLLGLIRLRQDDETRALASLRRAAELAPQVGYVHNNLGMALERCGRTAEALAAYRAAVTVAPGHVRAALNAARIAPLVPGRDVGVDEPLLAGGDPATASAPEEVEGVETTLVAEPASAVESPVEEAAGPATRIEETSPETDTGIVE